MGFIWLRMAENPELLLIVMYFLGDCWLYKKVVLWAQWPWNHRLISGRKKFLSSKSLENLHGDPSPATHSVCTQGKQLGQEAYHLPLSNARVNNMWNCMCCTSTPLYTLTVWCLMKHGDSFTLYGVCSCQWCVCSQHRLLCVQQEVDCHLK